MKQTYLLRGKKVKCDVLPQGYYVHDRESGHPCMVDPDYQGFRISYGPPESPKSGIQVITDAIEVKSVNDGKVYTSKSKYYASLKASGAHVTEAGEHGMKRSLQGDYNVRSELKQALQQHLGRT